MEQAYEVAEKIRKSPEWIFEDCEELCKLAGLEKEWQEADGESFEGVVFKAAEILGVEIEEPPITLDGEDYM